MNHKKIAEMAHVSVSTVSKALAGSAEISDETASMIRHIAMEMGYFKEKSKRKRAYTRKAPLLIALLIPEIIGSYYPAIVNNIRQIVEEKGGQTAIYIFDFETQKREKLLNSIITHGSADGVILFSPLSSRTQYNIPIVCCDTDHTGGNFDTVACDKRMVMDLAVSHLKALGHTSIGFVGDPRTSGSSNGFKEAMRRYGLPYKEEFSYSIGDRYEQTGVAAAERFLASEERPTAIVTAYDEIAHALIHMFDKNGVRVPEDISVIGVNNIVSSSYTHVPLTTIDIFNTEQYKMAVELLFDKILNDTEVVKHISVEAKLIVRESTAPPRRD